MKTFKIALLAALCATPALLILGAEKSKKPSIVDAVARGKYLATLGGCNDCHTPLKLTDKGPVPDMARMLSGHPHDTSVAGPQTWPLVCRRRRHDCLGGSLGHHLRGQPDT